VIRTDTTVIRDTGSVIEQLTKCNSLRLIDARKPSGQAVIQTQKFLFTKLQDEGSGEGLCMSSFFSMRQNRFSK